VCIWYDGFWQIIAVIINVGFCVSLLTMHIIMNYCAFLMNSRYDDDQLARVM